MLKVILPLAALIAFTACSGSDEDTGASEESHEDHDHDGEEEEAE